MWSTFENSVRPPPTVARTPCVSSESGAPSRVPNCSTAARAPGDESSEEFAARLLECGLIVSPGSFFGAAGEGYWRMALVATEEECRRAAAILEEIL